MSHRFLRAAVVVGIGFALPFVALRAEAETPAPKASADPAEISVVGTKEAETGGSVHSIKKKQLERFKFDDPHAIFLTVPGVYARGEDGFGLRPNIGIRGGNSDRSKKVTLTEDGVLFGPAPYSAPAAYYFPLIGRMRGVRVIKGPASIVYGPQTIGGAVDLATEDVPTTPEGMVDLAYGSFGYSKLHARQGLSGETVGLLVEGMHLGSSGFKHLDDPTGARADTGFLRREWMAKVFWQLPGNAYVQHDVGLKLGYSDEGSNETYLGLTDRDFAATPYRRYRASALDRMDWHRTSVVASHHARFGETLEITTSAYRHDLDRTWRKVNGVRGGDIGGILANPDLPANAVFYGVLTGGQDAGGPDEAILIGPNHRTFVSQGVQTVARVTSKGTDWENRFEYGARIHYDEISRLHTEDGFLMQSGQLVHDGRPTAITANNRAWTTAFALHAADAFAWNRLVVTPGIRVELIRSRFDDALGRGSSTGFHQVFLPGLGAYFALTKNLGVLAGVHRGFSPAPPGSATAGSTSGRPEDSINWEWGVRWTSKRVRAEAIAFFNDYRNLTNICTASSSCVGSDLDRQFDAGAAWVYGAEAFVETEIKTALGVIFPLRASYTLTRTEFLTPFASGDPQWGNVKAGDELPYVPRHQLSATLGAETKKWGVAAQAIYVDTMRESAGSGAFDPRRSTDAYLVVDVSGHYRITKWLSVYANLRNLTDRAYLVSRRPFGARPGAPRQIQVGLKVEF